MRDPERLINDGATEFERLLVTGAAHERPSAELGERMQAGLMRLIDSRAATAAKASTLPWAWMGGLAVVAGGLAAIAFVGLRPRAPEQPVAIERAAAPALPAAPQTAATGADAPGSNAAPSGAELNTGGTPVESRASMLQGRIEAKARGARPAKSPPADAPAAGGDLREEMLLLQRARSAIRERDGARALSELRDYAARFPSGTFVPEAAVLRIEALDLQGQHAQAAALGRRFLTTYADSPFADRVERITGPDR